MSKTIRLGKLISILQQVQREHGDDLNVVLWDSDVYGYAPDETDCDEPEGLYCVTNVEVRNTERTRTYFKPAKQIPVDSVYLELSTYSSYY